jgi:GT2 family glycosyltransferase
MEFDSPRITAVVLAFGTEPWLRRCIESILHSEDAEVDVVLVDNGCTDSTVDELRGEIGVKVIGDGNNLGFAAGSNLGAAHATGDVIAFINSDAYCTPGALASLAHVALRPDVGIASASLRLANAPQLLNSGGNDVHFLGFSWAGRFGERADLHSNEQEVTGATGAGMAMKRSAWKELGGFEERFFAYHEDADLSLRCWLRGFKIVYVPDSVVVHRYEFSRNSRKFYLMERNRLILVATVFGPRTLILASLALIAAEIGMVIVALFQGWLGQKVAGWGWLIRNSGWLIRRRRRVQADRRVQEKQIARILSGHFDSRFMPLPSMIRPIDGLFSAYWSMVRRLI